MSAKLLVAKVIIDDVPMIVEPSAIYAAIDAMVGTPKAGMKVAVEIRYEEISVDEFAALPEAF
jgi:hypothetical protein